MPENGWKTDTKAQFSEGCGIERRYKEYKMVFPSDYQTKFRFAFAVMDRKSEHDAMHEVYVSENRFMALIKFQKEFSLTDAQISQSLDLSLDTFLKLKSEVAACDKITKHWSDDYVADKLFLQFRTDTKNALVKASTVDCADIPKPVMGCRPLKFNELYAIEKIINDSQIGEKNFRKQKIAENIFSAVEAPLETKLVLLDKYLESMREHPHYAFVENMDSIVSEKTKDLPGDWNDAVWERQEDDHRGKYITLYECARAQAFLDRYDNKINTSGTDLYNRAEHILYAVTGIRMNPNMMRDVLKNAENFQGYEKLKTMAGMYPDAFFLVREKMNRNIAKISDNIINDLSFENDLSNGKEWKVNIPITDYNELPKEQLLDLLGDFNTAETVYRHLSPDRFSVEDFAEMTQKAVSTDGMILQYVPEELKNRELCKTAVTDNGLAFEYMRNYFKKDTSLCRLAVVSNGMALGLLPPGKRNAEICSFACEQDGRAFQFCPQNLKSAGMLMLARRSFDSLQTPEKLAVNKERMFHNKKLNAKKAAGLLPPEFSNRRRVHPIPSKDLKASDYMAFRSDLTPELKKDIQHDWKNQESRYKAEMAVIAKAAIDFRQGFISASQFLEQKPIAVNSFDMSASRAYIEAVILSQPLVNKYKNDEDIMRLSAPPTHGYNVDLKIPNKSMVEFVNEKYPQAGKDEKRAYNCIETLNAELARLYRTGKISAESYIFTPPTDLKISKSESPEVIKAAADKLAESYAERFREVDMRESNNVRRTFKR